jgi:hypothetical protein
LDCLAESNQRDLNCNRGSSVECSQPWLQATSLPLQGSRKKAPPLVMIRPYSRHPSLLSRTRNESGSVRRPQHSRELVCPQTPARAFPGIDRELTRDPGRLSLLTEDVVSAAAASEIKTGRRIGLGWSMRKLEHSQFGRQKCKHGIIALNGPGGSGLGACFDDVYEMNPRELWQLPLSRFALLLPHVESCARRCITDVQYAEQSSQWDGFRHYSQPRKIGDSSSSQDRVFYGGTTKEEIMDSSNYRIGIQHWGSQGLAGMNVVESPYLRRP